jgi:hypothetical protein
MDAVGPLHLLPVFLSFLVLGSLAAQPVALSKCLGGTLISVLPDSVTVKMNQRITVIRVTPETEIWRRGVDLDSTAKLVLGEEIFPICERADADGLPVATLVAETQGEDAVYLAPHHVHEIRACGGILIAAGKDTVTVRGDDGKVSTIHVTPQTEIWRGETYHDTSPLRRGDEITAACIVYYPDEALNADQIMANLASTEGVIVKVLPDGIVVDQYPGADKHSAYPRGHATVVIDARTTVDEGTRADLKPGRHVRAVGLELSRSKFRATAIYIYER